MIGFLEMIRAGASVGWIEWSEKRELSMLRVRLFIQDGGYDFFFSLEKQRTF